MKANELRIGNLVWLKCHHHPVSVEQIYKDDIDELVWIATDLHEGESLEDYDPIPLTEEWLVKFGFIEDNYGVFYTTKDGSNNSDSIIQMWAKKCLVEQWDISIGQEFGDTKNVCFIQFVHQLQNLYYALTVEELIYKP